MDITINLLPPDNKEELKNLKIAGAIFRVGVFGLLSLVVLFGFLQFCKQAILIEKRVFDQEVTRFVRTEAYLEAQKSQNEIKRHNKQASQIKSGLSSKKSYWHVVEEVNKIIPKDVYLREFIVSEEGVSFIGFAFYRESLLEFESKIEQSEVFDSVESPISNLVANENVKFELKAKLKK